MPSACPGESTSRSTSTCASIAALVALDPSVRVQVGPVHAAIDGVEVASTTPALWVWSSCDCFPPHRFHEETLEASIEAAHRFLDQRLAVNLPITKPTSLRASDEQEGGIIIPDYMY